MRLGAVPRLVDLLGHGSSAVAGAATALLELVAQGADAPTQQKAASSLQADGGVAQLVPRLKRAGGDEVARAALMLDGIALQDPTIVSRTIHSKYGHSK